MVLWMRVKKEPESGVEVHAAAPMRKRHTSSRTYTPATAAGNIMMWVPSSGLQTNNEVLGALRCEGNRALGLNFQLCYNFGANISDTSLENQPQVTP
jgi:hypothetical protein